MHNPRFIKLTDRDGGAAFVRPELVTSVFRHRGFSMDEDKANDPTLVCVQDGGDPIVQETPEQVVAAIEAALAEEPA